MYVYGIYNGNDNSIEYCFEDEEKRDYVLSFLGCEYYSSDIKLDDYSIDTSKLKKYYYIEIVSVDKLYFSRYERNNLTTNDILLIKDVKVTFIKGEISKITIPVNESEYESFNFGTRQKYIDVFNAVKNLKDKDEIIKITKEKLKNECCI